MRNTLLLVSLFLYCFPIFASTYYADPEMGNDSYAGTSSQHPFKSLKKLSEISLQPGDRILLAAGKSFRGSLRIEDAVGSQDRPIIITSYASGNTNPKERARIEAGNESHGIYVLNSSHIHINHILIEASERRPASAEATLRCGVLVHLTKVGDYADIHLSDLRIQNIFFEAPGFDRGEKEVRTANGSQRYGWGIRFINKIEQAKLQDIEVRNCQITNVAHTGIKFTGRKQNIQDVRVYDNQVIETGGPGIQLSGVLRGHIRGNFVQKSGSKDDSRKWGRGSGLWTWGCADILIEKNHFLRAQGPADSAGCHIDFNCKDVVVQYNVSAYNAGGFCEILGNNFNCAYRYNISVNDGHRVKGENGAFQEGKTFWLSGYVGKKKKRHGPYHSYFYNNTIYVSQDIDSKIAVTKTAQGVLVANNIFYLEGEVKAVLGDQYKPAQAGGEEVEPVFFENNLFLKPDSWPEETLIQPGKSSVGDPQFLNKGGMEIKDYIPQKTRLVKNKGISIQALPGDKIGLRRGLKVSQDILGNKIIGKPDLGAIEVE